VIVSHRPRSEQAGDLKVLTAGSGGSAGGQARRVSLAAPRAAVRVAAKGLYAEDTRYLSELHLTFGALEPVLLSHTVVAGYGAVVDATNPTLAQDVGLSVAQETLNLRRTLLWPPTACTVGSSCATTVRVRSLKPGVEGLR
jgi:hypothetical protein